MSNELIKIRIESIKLKRKTIEKIMNERTKLILWKD